MGEDEAGTLAAVKALRAELVGPKIAEHRGRIFKTTGDGVLAEFPSVVNAVACAVEIQRGGKTRNADVPDDRAILLRIGISLGDVVIEGDDIFGDGVNVAARLEGIALPGCVAVSGVVREQVGNRLELQFEDIGEKELKNIQRAIRVFRILPDTHRSEAPKLALPSKPSIAVLPFINMSTDPEHESFVDGLTEDLITDLSRNDDLFVIARNSTFAYKGRSVDVRRIASELGVRYLLEGSARRSAGRVRVNVQLIDATGGGHLWAERFDRSLEDVFAVQDEVTSKIIQALIGRLKEQPVRNRPANMQAYDLCVRARGLSIQTALACREATFLMQRAIAIDPEYAEAHRWLALNLWLSWEFWDEPMDPNRVKAVEEARRAVALDPNDAGNRWVLAVILGHDLQWEESDAEFDAAFAIDSNNADAWAMRSDLLTGSGRPADAIEHVQKGLRLNPHPPGWYYWLLGQAQYALRDYETAVQTFRRPETYRTTSRRMLAASLAQLGRLEEAHQEAELFMMSNPHFTIRYWAETQPFRDGSTLERFVEGYRKAGLPE
ncbi:adenylate/guanylate cyclase domain-containing protein [Nordella sp. HKS 07]|uniref:adenylate/guanylate cyclase domain-containing protein n=1 Tax=Nordella sp. HKS 07 TaxID=2712222 RepID=UPI0013E132F7|nr:adenylate/guanylate cyclase domain-containing protein [Nordella sp. HKS 07]